MAMADRRRANPPSGGTKPPVFTHPPPTAPPVHARGANEIRKIYLRTNLVPSASGSAYLELSPSAPNTSQSQHSFVLPASTLKLTCSVHGPKPLPRNHPYTPSLVLTTTVKFAPFAGRVRRGYVRDAAERDLAAHLEAALRGVVLAEKWPKSGVEVVVTILEGEEQLLGGHPRPQDSSATKKHVTPRLGESTHALMGALSGCVTVSTAALASAGIECADLAAGGTAAVVRMSDVSSTESAKEKSGTQFAVVLDPSFVEHDPADILAVCAVCHLPKRDELSEVWIVGDLPLGLNEDGSQPKDEEQPPDVTSLVDGAARAARAASLAVKEAVREGLGIEND